MASDLLFVLQVTLSFGNSSDTQASAPIELPAPRPISRLRALCDCVVFSAVFLGVIEASSSSLGRAAVALVPPSLAIPVDVYVIAQITIVLVLALACRDPDMRRSLGLARERLASAVGIGLATWLGLMVFVVVVALVMLGAQAFANQAAAALPPPHLGSLDDVRLATEFARIPLPLVVPLACFVGFYEEMLFRGFFLGRLRILFGERAWGAVLAVVVSSAVFALGHTYKGALGIAGTFVIGIVFGVVAWRRKSIGATVTAHALLDTTVLVAIHFARPLFERGFGG